MNDKTKRVFNGWLALSDAERDEFKKARKEYKEATPTKQQQLRESSRDQIQKMQTGPLSQGCPCCGR
jgi:hypothetical protein